jgi:outer membrane protein assembly factor BamC
MIGVATLLAGCSWLTGREDAGEAATLPPLQVPPDLLSPRENPQFVLPEVPQGATPAATPTDARRAEPPTLGERVLPPGQGVQRVRDGQHRWLLVSAEPEQVWPLARKFLEMRGYRVARDEPAVGLLETDWKERFADADSNGVPNWRERLRIRIEPAEQAGSAEIYLSQANSERVAADGEQWALRAPNNERAVEMLNRLARYLAAEDVEDAVPLTPLASRLDVDEDNNVALFVEAPVETVWRRIGIALDALGFVIEDQDRANRIYHVYNEVSSGKTEEEIKYGKPEPATVRESYQLHLHADGERTVIAVHNKSGQRDTTGVARHVLNLLHSQLQ